MKLEIMSGGIADKEEGKNHKEGGCHHDQERQRKDISAGEIDGQSCPRRESWLRRRRAQQGMASDDCMGAHRDCCLKRGNEQSGRLGANAATSCANSAGISREINLAATLPKPLLIRVLSFEVEQTRR